MPMLAMSSWGKRHDRSALIGRDACPSRRPCPDFSKSGRRAGQPGCSLPGHEHNVIVWKVAAIHLAVFSRNPVEPILNSFEFDRQVAHTDIGERKLQWYSRQLFPHDDIVLVTWKGAAWLTCARPAFGKNPGKATRRAGIAADSKLIDHVVSPMSSSPHWAIAIYLATRLSSGWQESSSVPGLCASKLTESGRARRDKVIELVRESARQSLGSRLTVARAESSPSTFATEQSPLNRLFTAATRDGTRNDAGKTASADTSAAADGADGVTILAGESSLLPPHDLTVTGGECIGTQ